jgi:mono/diheme cytochrome c family protein
MKPLLAMLALAASCSAQNVADVVKQGEQVFAKTCATGYCHGVKGASSGAPRLAGRGFDQAYIANVIARGVPDTGMASFATRLSRPELTAVVAYVATLNGIANPTLGAEADLPSARALTGDAARGAELFKEAVRGFGRCATCHEVAGFGIPVAGLITKIPASAAALKALATPNVKTAALDGESMPALVLSEGKQGPVFYDLTSAPPVQRNAIAGSVKFTDGSQWRHSSAIGAYNDSELAAILAYLRAAIKP